MAVTIKSDREIALMTQSGQILAQVHEELRKALREGMTTLELDSVGEEIIRSYGCTPSFLHYMGYPASLCISVNDRVVHGIPSDSIYMKDGDIVSIDAGVCYKGYHSDAARTYGIGEVSREAQALMAVTEESFFKGLQYAREGCRLNDISTAIGMYLMQQGYGVVTQLCGHGIGTALHEAPEVPNFPKKRKGIRLKAGMTLAIEPMVNVGSGAVRFVDDWTVVTYDGSLSAHYENTVLITGGEPRVLTLLEEVDSKDVRTI